MKTLTSVIFGCLIFSAIGAPVDTLTGFRDLTFGESKDKVTGLSPADLEPKGDTHYYKRDSDSLSVGGKSVDFIIYGFTNDTLCSVWLNYKIEDADAVLKTYTKVLGEPEKQPEKSANGSELKLVDGSNSRIKYIWKGDKVRATLTITRANLYGKVYPVTDSMVIESIVSQTK